MLKKDAGRSSSDGWNAEAKFFPSFLSPLLSTPNTFLEGSVGNLVLTMEREYEGNGGKRSFVFDESSKRRVENFEENGNKKPLLLTF